MLLFAAGTSAPLLGVRLGNHGWDIANRAENRRLSDEPDLLHMRERHIISPKARLLALAKFPGQFKYYFSQHFGLRSLLIRAHGMLMVRGLGVTSNPGVILGKDGWLYLANEGSLDDWRNVIPFSRQELEQWRQMLEERNQFCADHGIPYLVVIAPSKYDIYPEYMPDNLKQVRGQSRLDQLLQYLKEHNSPVQIVDLRKPLLDAKSKGVRLYQKTDTHWNDRGGWIAYQAMMRAVAARLPSARALPESDFQPVVTTRPGRDLAGLLGLNDEYSEQSLDLKPNIRLRLPHVQQNDVQPIIVDSAGSAGPRIVMFRDSFFTNVLPWVAQSFGHGVYLWEDGFDEKLIKAVHPDIVIQQWAQRKLMQPLRCVNGKWELPSTHP